MGEDIKVLTLGSVARFIFTEPGKVFIFKPGHIRVVVRIVLLLCPLCHFASRGLFRRCKKCKIPSWMSGQDILAGERFSGLKVTG